MVCSLHWFSSSVVIPIKMEEVNLLKFFDPFIPIFKRVNIKARKTAVVEIPLSAEDIDLFNPETGKMEAASGEYIIYYGGTSDISKLRKLKIKI